VWTKITRPKYERSGQRYASDLTDAEWAVIEPHMPAPKPLGRPRSSAYAGDKLRKALARFGYWSTEIVRRMADSVGFAVLPRRWVVERTLASLNRNRRLAKDFGASISAARAWVYVASVQLLIRRIVCY
jgi:transposase